MSDLATVRRIGSQVVVACMVIAAPAQTLAAEKTCAELKSMVVPARAIALPTRGATILSAELIAATAAATTTNGTYVAAVQEYCKLLGTIAPMDSSAPLINFQVNLPTRWNAKALQFGGGGFNGTLVTGLGAAPDAPPGTPSPLDQGYATLGTDAGHQVASLPEMQAFALNDEALLNFAYASYKKVRDVAVELIRQRYGRPPTRIYYVGASEGGREGLTMAQRFPTDYDGVISRVPVINWTGLQHAGLRSGVVQQNGGWLNAAKVSLVARAVLSACDTLDGLADGIVSNYLACGSTVRLETLRCSLGTDAGDDCLSDQQLAATSAAHSTYTFPFALANGVRTYPAFGFGGETQAGGFGAWVTGARPAAFPAPATGGQAAQWTFGNGVIRYFVIRDAKANPLTYSAEAYAERVRQISDLMDSTNPDLSAFAKHGGKLIIKEHLADYAQSPFAGIEYYESVVARMGRETVDRFARLYVTPGVNHGGRGVSGTTGEDIPSHVDLLGALDAWVESGRAPGKSLIQTSVMPAPPFTVLASRPMCSYPQYPRYRGSGDTKLASSFVCTE